MSTETFRLGVAGLSHGHVWGIIDGFEKVAGVKLAAVSDESDLLERVAPKFDASFTDWRELLAKSRLDGLVVTSNTLESSEIATSALDKGIPCFVEKPMAVSGADADRMLAAQKASGKTLMINWPMAWLPGIHDFARRIAAGEIGKVFHSKFRVGHRGPKEIGCDPEFYNWLYDEKLNGGGAIADFGNYGAVLFRWILGMPETVYGVRGVFTKDYPAPDDHAVCLLRYPKGTAIVEGTWSTAGFDPSGNPVAHGSTGTLSVFGDEVVLNRPGEEERTSPPALPIGDAAHYFVDCVRTGKKPEGVLDPEIAADACRIIDAAKRSNETGCAEKP